ncbi:MAG: hypothetical protein AB1705_13370 [Verrucomicrobiota bacterium]
MKFKHTVVFALAALLWSGCKPEPVPPAAAPTPQAKAPVPLGGSSDTVAPPVPGAPADVPATATAEMPAKPDEPSEGLTPEPFNTALIGLQEAVDQYIQDTKRNPATLQDVVKAGFLERIPPAPKGKRFIIDQKTFQVKEANQ